MSETLKVLETRRSCRAFKPELIEEEKLQAIIKAGTYAATGMGRQSPVIIAVTNKELRDKLADELMYISHHPKESPFHLIGHLYLFLDYLIQSAHSTQLLSNNKMSDYYIKQHYD